MSRDANHVRVTVCPVETRVLSRRPTTDTRHRTRPDRPGDTDRDRTRPDRTGRDSDTAHDTTRGKTIITHIYYVGFSQIFRDLDSPRSSVSVTKVEF